MTKAEQAKCLRAFKAFDKDGSGYIDANELRLVFTMLGQKTTEEELYRMILTATDDIEADFTGKLTYPMFLRVIDQ